jgi:membrane associated rhomboid family serine protease
MSITLLLIITTVVISYISFNNSSLKEILIFSPYQYINNKKWWVVVSHGFIHADYLHLFFNMYVLYAFGFNVENQFNELNALGYLYFLILYLGAMIFATLPSIIKHRNNNSYRSLGASGAVSAVVFVFIILAPTAQMGLIILPGLYIPAFIFGLLYFIAENYMIKKGGSNIAHDAHIAGAIFGILFVGFFDYKLYINFIESIVNYIGIS